MVLESDKTTEARRKAMRNGEEDPLVVAQRFLNIYRQMHIFSPERKEAFNKMLLELSPEIRGLFSSLPGGVMLQDYVDDLAEKNGVQKSIHPAASPKLNEDAHQQAQILATALAQAQTQARPQMPPQSGYMPPQGGAANLVMDKDFAGEFARIIGGVMEQQTLLQKENLEKLSEKLTKTQLVIAQSIKENKGEQKSDDIKEICKVIIEVYKRAKEDQQANIGEICKTIAQGQTALSASLGSRIAEIPVEKTVKQDEAAQRLMEVVLDGQKQLDSRLSKVEELSLSRANDNKALLAVFEKSQTEMIKSLKEIQEKEVVSGGNEEKLAKLIGDSQEKLIHTILAANIQQNTATSQANNNANNIQINAADNSAQMLLLVDKIASLQAASEQNLEKAIAKILETQGSLYDRISRRQTEELAQIMAKSLAGVKKECQEERPVENAKDEPPFETIQEPMNDKISEDRFEKEEVVNQEQTAVPIEMQEKEPRKKKKKKKKRGNIEQKPVEDIPEDNPFDKEDFSIDDLPNIEELFQDENKEPSEIKEDALPQMTEQNVAEQPIVEEMPEEETPQESADEDFPKFEDFFGEEQKESEEDEPYSEDVSDLSGDDWGFGAASSETSKKAASEDNDNNEGTDWVWDYVDETAPEETDGEAIGENSYIYSDSLFNQEQVANGGVSIYGAAPEKLSFCPKIIGMDKTPVEDPYQNSILKN